MTDKSGDIELWLMLSIHYIIFAPEMAYLDHDEVDYSPLSTTSKLENVVYSISPELSAYYWQLGWY